MAKREPFYNILDNLRYQVLTPEVTTMGQCFTEGCTNLARGAAECPDCLLTKLARITNNDYSVSTWYWALRALQEQRLLVDELYAELLEKYGDD